jgi:hypothetical protein
VLLGAPFLVVPILAARALFVGFSSALLAFLLTRTAWWPLLACASAPFWSAAFVAQWSLWLTSVAFAPWLGFLLAAKPNIGLAILAAADSRRAFTTMVVGMVILTAAAFVVMPHWFASWMGAVRGAGHVRPLLAFRGGWVFLLTALRWRLPQARLLLTMAILPQNPGPYEGLLLFLIPRTPREALVLVTLSWLVEPLASLAGPPSDFAAFARATGYAMLLLMYLPAMVLVFRYPKREAPTP